MIGLRRPSALLFLLSAGQQLSSAIKAPTQRDRATVDICKIQLDPQRTNAERDGPIVKGRFYDDAPKAKWRERWISGSLLYIRKPSNKNSRHSGERSLSKESSSHKIFLEQSGRRISHIQIFTHNYIHAYIPTYIYGPTLTTDIVPVYTNARVEATTGSSCV